jgi:type IV pilus assembly protein PilM
MPANSRLLALNIGTQTVHVAEFRTGADGSLILHGLHSAEMAGSESGSDATRPASVTAAISEAAQGIKLKGIPTNYAVSAQSVFTRFVKLPAVDEGKIDQIVQFEAQQNVPFPISEVVWDYQIVGAGDDGRMEVVLVAIKSDLLNEINQGVEGAGLRPVLVDVAPMALFNAFRYNYSDLEGCTLLIDIGARTTNLLFVEPKKIFSRSIPIGGNTITSAVAKELQIPYAAAERRKKEKGYVSLGGSYAEDDNPDVARMSKIIRNTMTRLHAEITRSIGFYRAQQQGSQPARIFLCGGSANLPYMREFFTEKLQIPVEYFNPFRNVGVGGDVDVDMIARNAHGLGEIVGLGLRGASECPMELNLRPASVIRQQRLSARKPALMLSGVALLLALAGWWLYYLRGADIKTRVLENVKARVVGLQAFEKKFKQAGKQLGELKAIADPLAEATAEREFWIGLTEDIHQRLPKEFIWLTAFEPTADGPQAGAAILAGPADYPKLLESVAKAAPGGKEPPKSLNGLRLRGLYFGNPPNPKQQGVVDNFVENLKASPYVAEAQVIKRSTPTQTEWAYDFELQLKLKQGLRVR